MPNLYHWLFSTVQAELSRNFPNNDESFEMTEYISEELWCKACLDNQFDD